MNKALFVIIPTLLCVQTAEAGFVKDYFDATQAMSNVTQAGVREAGAVTAVTGGGFVYRTPRTDFVPFSVTPRRLKPGAEALTSF